jgi:hypothetical protein
MLARHVDSKLLAVTFTLKTQTRSGADHARH